MAAVVAAPLMARSNAQSGAPSGTPGTALCRLAVACARLGYTGAGSKLQ